MLGLQPSAINRSTTSPEDLQGMGTFRNALVIRQSGVQGELQVSRTISNGSCPVKPPKRWVPQIPTSVYFYGPRYWSWREDLNPRPADYKSAALPAELRQHWQSFSSKHAKKTLCNSKSTLSNNLQNLSHAPGCRPNTRSSKTPHPPSSRQLP